LGTVDDSARVAVEICMGVVPGEHVLIVTDNFTLTVGEALRKGAEKVSQNARLVLLEDFCKRPLTSLVGNLLQDEKLPSVHVAFGDPYRDETGADWQSRTHIDAIMKNATLRVDGTTLMKNGRFLL